MVYHWKVLWKFSISRYNFSLFLSRLTWSKLETSPQILHTGTKLGKSVVFSCSWDSLVYYTLWTVFMIVFTRINVALFVTYNYPIGWSITHQITRRGNGGLPQRWGTTEKMKLVELSLGAQNLVPTYDAGFSGPVMQVFKLNPEPGSLYFQMS